MSTEKKKAPARNRNFATVVYPESSPVDWLQRLSDEKVPIFISPLHDKDINPTGEPKKPHYHVMIMFEGKKSEEQIREIFDNVNGVGLEVVKSLRAYARYLCHLDNPDKVQYKIEDVISLSSADYMGVIGLAIDKYIAIKEIIEFCCEMGIYTYAELLEYCMIHRFDWYRVLCDNGTYVVKEYLKSKYWLMNNAPENYQSYCS